MKSRLVKALIAKRASARAARRPPVRRRLGLETLEARSLLAVIVPGSESTTGNVHKISVVTTAEPSLAGAQRSISPSVMEALQRASNLDSYPAETLATVNQWILFVPDAEQFSAVRQTLGANTLRPTGIIPGTYVYSPGGQSVQSVIAKLNSIQAVELFYPLVTAEVQTLAVPDDPLFPQQWHLDNTGTNTGPGTATGTVGLDANVVEVWDDFRGAGVTIGIVDEGVEYTHPDLAANYDGTIDFDFITNDSDPFPLASAEAHGTAVAGVAAAVGNNTVGVSGSAPEATITSIRAIGAAPVSDLYVAQLFAHENDAIDIYNNSWGPALPFFFAPLGPVFFGPLTMAAAENAVLNGRGGLGNVFMFAGGNSRQALADTNTNPLLTNRFTTTVAAIDQNGQFADYSNPGATVLISGYSNNISTVPPTDPAFVGITTTDRAGASGYNQVAGIADLDPQADLDYTSTFGGTSSATPLVSGVVALMLQANPNLTWRDVQHILVESARMTDANSPGWALNGAGFFVSHDYGFGAIDAQAAVTLAQNFSPVNPEFVARTGILAPALPIPDNNPVGVQSQVTVDIPDTDMILEHVEVRFTTAHTFASDLTITLVSPSGTRSVLANARLQPLSPGPLNEWVFQTVHNWGESPEGTWTLEVSDQINLDVGNIDEFELIFYGEENDGEKIRGAKWNDRNEDGIRDVNEPGLPGWTIYVDENNNSIRDLNELFAVTDINGNYELDISSLIQQQGFGSYVVREVLQFGWEQTFPTSTSPLGVEPPTLGTAGDGFYIVTIDQPDRVIAGVDFGNVGLPGEIRGVKFFDANGNAQRDSGEAGQPGVTIQLFDSQNVLLQTTATDAFGAYVFTDLRPDNYVVRELVPTNQTQTFPGASASFQHNIDLQATQIRINIDFGNFGQRGSISGRKWHDVDGDGFKDLDELGIADVLIYVDINRDGVLNLGEPVQQTDQFGYYKLPNLVPGQYQIRELVPDGDEQTVPGGGFHTVTVISGQEIMNVNFGNHEFRDYGDAPAPYPTTKAQNGAAHGIRAGFHLGQRVDAEPDGQPNATATGDDATGTSFEPGVSYTVGDAPLGALTADLDGERGPDLVVVNQNSSNISVLLNNSDGTFADAVPYNVGANPSRVAAADFDGDGDLDLAVSNTGSNNVSVLINRGDGTFMTAVNEPAGAGPRGIATGDLDGDGLIDIAVSNSDEVVSVLINDGAGGFDPPIEFMVNEGPVADVAIGDLDRDGDRDLIVVSADGNTATVDNKLSVLYNGGVISGNLTFGPAFDFIVGEEPLQVILADFDRDGFLDAATANAVGESVSVLLNRGTGTFFPGTDYDVGGPAQSLVAADINNDTFRDIVVAAQTSGLLPVLLNNGNGVFTRGADLVGGSIGVFVVSADFNNDGGRDVAVVNQVADSITVINSAGDDEDGVTFSTLVRGTTGAAQVTASAAGILSAWIDFNADGDWNDPGEKFVSDRALTAGVNQIFFTIPATAVVGNTFARFRFSDQTGIGPAGLARAGEVEDYQVAILATGGGGSIPGSYQNPANPFDVSGEGQVTLNDVLLLINDLRMNGARLLPMPPPPGEEPPPFLDPSGDGRITLNDVLLVINALLLQNAQANGEAEGEFEDSAPFVLLDRPASSSASRTRREEDELETCTPIVAGPAAEDAPETGAGDSESLDLIGDGEDSDWDDALEAIAGDVSQVWSKGAL